MLSKTTDTSANEARERRSPPAKMTSSILRPRMSFAWPEPSTHLTASTMLVLPEPFGPTIPVTPPSKRISVARANVLNPNKLSERKNKGGNKVADGPATCLLGRFTKLAASGRLQERRLWFGEHRQRRRFRSRLGRCPLGGFGAPGSGSRRTRHFGGR